MDELKQKQDEIILIKLKHDEEMKQIKDQLQDFVSSVKIMDKKGKQKIAERMINKGIYVKKPYA